MLQKLMPSSEVEQAQAQVLERLQSIKDMLRRMGDHATGPEQPHRQEQRSKRLGIRRQEITVATNESSTMRTADATPETEELVKPPPAKPRKLCVDAGTDPLETLMGNNNNASPPPVPMAMSRGHEMETQTVEFHSEKPEEEEPERVLPEQTRQDNGALIELEMKQFLAMFVNNQTPDEDISRAFDENQSQDVESATESPRLELIKTSEQRKPPNTQSKQGYRSFRLPTARSRPNTPAMNTA